MSKNDNPWKNEKDFAMKRFQRELDAGKVDIEIVDIINKINQTDDYYTTSTCSGRVQLIDIASIEEMNGERLINSHSEISSDEIINLKFVNFLLLLSEPPIFHIVAKDEVTAKKILLIGQSCGFKRTGIRSIKNKRYTVEILSTEFLKIPLGKDGIFWIKEEKIGELVVFVNDVLKRGKKKLEKLRKELKLSL